MSLLTQTCEASAPIFDIPITYDVNDLGRAGTCLVANVDLSAR